MTSVDNTVAIGLDINLAPTLKTLHNRVDNLINNVDMIIENTQQFYDGFDKQLKDKDQFYKTDQEFSKKTEKEQKQKAQDAAPLRLERESIEDIKYGADNIRIGLKEKYLGRKPGMKRGEAET